MADAAETNEEQSVIAALARKWRIWQRRRAAMAELDHCGSAERHRIAADLGMNEGELCVLAGRWPDNLDLLRQRLDQLKLNASDGAQIEPEVRRDLQRTCALCASKRRCTRDLERNPADPMWEDYCPNAITLSALLAEAGRRVKPGHA